METPAAQRVSHWVARAGASMAGMRGSGMRGWVGGWRWWPGALAALVVGAGPGLAGATVVCLGDSITAGRGLDEDQAYPALVEALARQDQRAWTVVNAGVSGDTSAGGLRRVDWVLRAHPDVVLVALGGNDGLRGQPVAAMRDNLLQIIDRCAAAHVRVAVAGMQMPTNYGADYRADFAAVFPAVAAARQVPLMPFLLAGVGGHPDLNQADGIHPTAAGQAIIARAVYAFLIPVVEGGAGATAASVAGSASAAAPAASTASAAAP
jgi:acyl-CoA thioesterase-1